MRIEIHALVKNSRDVYDFPFLVDAKHDEVLPGPSLTIARMIVERCVAFGVLRKAPDLLSDGGDTGFGLPSARPGRGRGAKLVRPRWDEWNEAREDAFLEKLAETANITLSARAIGIDVSTVHKRRRRWPAFDAAVRRVGELAAESLNLKLLHEGSNSLSPPAVPGVIDPPLVSVDQAIKIVQMNLPELRLRGPTGRRVGRPCKWQPAPPPSEEEMIASIEPTLARLPPLEDEEEGGEG